MGSLWVAQRLSPLSSGYRKLSAAERLGWEGRLPSTLHALAITGATIYLFLCSPVFAEDHTGDRPFVLRTSPLSGASLGFSLGYFATDLLLLVLYYPSFGGPEMGVHHLAALASVAAAALQGQAHAYTLALLATECTTPFVNVRFLLDKAGWKDHPIYTANGMALLLSWLVARILLFLKFFQHVATHLHEFHLISPLSRWLIYLVPPTLFVLNVFWFTKIFKGVIKLLLKPAPKQPEVAPAGPEAQAAAAAAAAAPAAGSAAELRKER
ncbi:hypothetical protein ABPG75_001431 [Micractinium tetrahymenae]